MQRCSVGLQRRLAVGAVATLLLVSNGRGAVVDQASSDIPGFREVWGYVYKGAERALTGPEPITDVGYFSVVVNDVGRLDPGPFRPVLASVPGRIRRVHLVISAPANKSLMYLCLSRDLTTRDGLINDIVQAGTGFDGVQIDFEGIRPEERSAYLAFLGKLKASLPATKTLSVAVLARTKKLDDVFDYPAIAAIADRVIVMAYDEHWRTGSPGPIASLTWCKQVCQYARQAIPPEKLIMGLPLYGRAWQVETLAQALTLDQTQKVLRSLAKTPSRDDEGIPFFEYQQMATLKVYYEDVESLSGKMALYHDQGVQAVAFWRVGQGSQELWDRIRTTD